MSLNQFNSVNFQTKPSKQLLNKVLIYKIRQVGVCMWVIYNSYLVPSKLVLNGVN